MVALFDVNVLVALAWPNHVHHQAATGWFERHHHDGWATCPLTQSGFVRVSSNHRVVEDARSPADAIDLLQRMTSLPHHTFWTDDVAIVDSPYVAREKLVAHGQVTDAHLLALALARGGRLVTFDRAIRRLAPSPQAGDASLHVILHD